MAYVPGVALLAALVAGCTAGSGADDPAADSKPGSPTVSAAPPGQVPDAARTLRRRTALHAQGPAARRRRACPRSSRRRCTRARPPSPTTPTARSAAAGSRDAPDATRNLSIDFERVVSYDPAVSDDDRAREVYAKKEDGRRPSGPSAGVTAERDARRRGRRDGDGAGEGTDPSGSPSGIASGPDLRRSVRQHLRGTDARRGPPAATARTSSATRRSWTTRSPGPVPPHSTAP